MKFHVMTIAIMLTAPSAFSQESVEMTIAQAIERALDKNPQLEQATEAVNATVSQVSQSRSGYFPTSDVDLNYVRLGPISELGFPGLGVFQLFSANNWDEHVSLRQTVFDFGKTSAYVDASQSTVQSVALRLDLLKTSIGYETVKAFYGMLYFRQCIDIQNGQIDALIQHQVVTGKKIEAGTATDFDTLTTRVRITAVQNKVTDHKNDLRKREATLQKLLGLPPHAEIRVLGEFADEEMSLNTDSLVAIAHQRRRELQVANSEAVTAELRQRAVSLSDMPALRIEAEYGLKNGFFPNLDAWRGNWVLGVNANIPLFNGYKTRSQEQELAALRMEAEAYSRDVERMVTSDVLLAISDVQANREKIRTSAIQMDQATKALALANLRYDSGVATNLDVIDAHTNILDAQLAHLEALYNFVLSRYALEKAVGADLAGR